MSNTRLIIKTAEVTTEGILIRSVEIIDGFTGETKKVAKLTKELAEFFTCVEIDMDRWFELKELQEKNPAVKILIESFRLFT